MFLFTIRSCLDPYSVGDGCISQGTEEEAVYVGLIVLHLVILCNH